MLHIVTYCFRKEINMKKIYWIVLINTLIPLLVGFVFYCVCGKNTYINELFCYNKQPISNRFFIMSNWGCDFLWAYALAFSVHFCLKNYRYTIFVTTIVAGLLECAQLIKIDGLKCGTFDSYDIFVEFIGIFVAMLINYLFERGR